ncbi:MAG: ABC transporter ATP-binding protein [Clostridia bacterium]|nr:ABC transporter ATP-binding protein [Clostridia bacterium]
MKKAQVEKRVTWAEIFKDITRARALIHKYRPQMVLIRWLRVIFEALTPYVGIYLSAQLIDELSGARDPEHLKILVWSILLAAAVITVISVLLNRWIMKTSDYLWHTIQWIYGDKMLSMDYTDIDDTSRHELLEKIKQNQYGGGWGIYHALYPYENLISALLQILGGVALTVSLFTSRVPDSAGGLTVLNHPLFILLMIIIMLFITWLAPILSNRAGSYWAKNQHLHLMANRQISFYFRLASQKDMATDIRMYRQDTIYSKFVRDKNGTFYSKGEFAKYAQGSMGFLYAASAAVSIIFTGVVYVFVCLKAWGGAFGIGSVTQYIAAITAVSGGMATLISTMGKLRNNAPFLKLIFEFLDIPNNMYQGSLTVEKRRDHDYEVEFRDVSFKYPGSEQYALRHVNMKFKVGSRLAVVGMNGSGKTTFIKLLCRLYDPTEGVILLNGIDIRKYNYLDYMMIFSVVFQDFRLFALKLGENVASGRDYDPDLVTECLIKAGFGDRLKALPDGLDTYLYKDYNPEGIDISGGEAQKIAIARALYKDAPFIILDEPTAALDPIAEAEIYSKFNDIAGDKTAIYISHRLSSCKFCDEIAVFHEGQVIQKGSHSELLADESGKYFELWNAQAQYYTEKETT